jgi:DNA (cytosine-5)-methyltransferase 1
VNFIELFAGCGGLSLGLKSVGFELVMANELSPMAAETYAYNLLNEDLQAQSQSAPPKLAKVVWLSSQYSQADLKLRLREDPRRFPLPNEGYSDIAYDGNNIKGSLVVGSIVSLNQWIKGNPNVAKALAEGFGTGGVDLVSGGPPCQSFSMAGLRRKDCEKNALPWEFAQLAQVVNPKFILLENVTGILRPFSDDLGDKYYAWYELAKAFAEVGYVPLCLHINAKFAGVPQNRPRFILIGVRQDTYASIAKTFNETERILFSQPIAFFSRIQSGEDVPYGALVYRDAMSHSDLGLFSDSFLSPLVEYNRSFVSVRDAIDDLREGGNSKAKFPRHLALTFRNVLPSRELKNHELRSNNPLVQRRFRLYQILQEVGNGTHKRVLKLLNGESQNIDDHDWFKLASYDYLLEDGSFKTFQQKSDFVDYLKRHPTKKQTQRALLPHEPAPAALSIPDDACHYHHDELRTLTVREMARIQSFPDNFEFRSKVTTGGQMRSFEVPQYTQVGNAVPPLLARALGMTIKDLLSRI